MKAVIKPHGGTPTLFIDDKPIFYGLMWGSAPTPDTYDMHSCASRYADTGIHFFTFDMGTAGNPPDWCGPKPGFNGHFDFTGLEKRFQQVINADLKAKFHLRIHLEMPKWWQDLYPDECEVVSDGRRLSQSYASLVWRDQAKEFLKCLVEYINKVGMTECVVAYQVATGSSGEWVKGPSAMGLVCGDYSSPMKKQFQDWLRRIYLDDENALRSAWNNPTITFDTAYVPSADAQLHTKQFTFRDPRKEQQVIDYFRCLSDLCADLLIDFCTTVKNATGGKALAGAFYGYLMELAWNAGFFGEGVDSEYSTYQRSGHLGLQKVLASTDVDFMVSPYSYGFRGIGGEGCAMPPSESLRIHNKLYIYEDDTRTYLSLHDHPNYGKTNTFEDNVTILKRNFAYVLTHGQAMWWLSGGAQTPHIDLVKEPRFQALIHQFQEIGSFAINLDRKPNAEIAVLLDGESFYYEWLKNNLDLPLIFQQRLWGLPRIGAPFDVYLLDDFLHHQLKPYKLYIFLNAFHLNKQRREELKHEIRKDGRCALWIYAPGYIDEDCSVAHMVDLTRIKVVEGLHPWGPHISIINTNHPITQGLTNEFSWGSNSLIFPVFHVDDHDCLVLGNVIYSQGRCLPGLVLKEYPEWKSIYCAVPNLPAGILKGIATYAGVHQYSQVGDVLYATRDLLAIHTATGGKRNLTLPRKVETVYDLFANIPIAAHVDRFDIDLPPASTTLFFTGEDDRLKTFHDMHNDMHNTSLSGV